MSRTASADPLVIFVTNRVFPEVISFLGKIGHVISNPDSQPSSREQFFENASRASALMVFMNDWLDAGALDRCPQVRIIAGALKGCDNFDVAACTSRGIWFTIVPDILTIPTAELAIALALGLSRKILEGNQLIRSGAFAGWRPVLYGTALHSRTAGIVGMGNLGRAIAKRLAAFEMRILYFDIAGLPSPLAEELSATSVGLGELLASSDFVFLAMPLSPETKHLIDAASLQSVKAGSFLINVGRGSVVDENAVATALESGRLAGYAADVFEMEDWALVGRPKSIHPVLLTQSHRTLFTPHLGSAVTNVRYEVEMCAARNIVEALSGRRPPDAINDPVARSRLSR
jgi:phosphonate dehydrogenase